MQTYIYCGAPDGVFHHWVEQLRYDTRKRAACIAWWFPEIDHGSRGGADARHPARIIELIPEMIGRRIVTNSEHIVLAFQQLIRQGKLTPKDVRLYSGNYTIPLDSDGDIYYWPGGFFNERLGLLR